MFTLGDSLEPSWPWLQYFSQPRNTGPQRFSAEQASDQIRRFVGDSA
jgi:hypothetical protein